MFLTRNQELGAKDINIARANQNVGDKNCVDKNNTLSNNNDWSIQTNLYGW